MGACQRISQSSLRLAQEYDVAQDRGEVQRHGGDKSNVGERNVATAADLGLHRDEIHEALLTIDNQVLGELLA
jgi:hypothetical protein